MFGFINKAAAPLFLAGAIILTACAPAAIASPTPDLNQIQTEVAVTVQAGLTQTAAAMPTATITPDPTKTTQPTATKAVTTVVSTLAPLVTSTQSASAIKDKGQWLYNVPDDTKAIPVMTPGAEFTVTWHVKNVGTTTWTTKYAFRYFLADPSLRLGANDITMPKEVKPNEEVDLNLTFKAPTQSGDYTTWWVITNEEGANFLNVNFTFRIGSGPAATTAPSATVAVSPTTATTP